MSVQQQKCLFDADIQRSLELDPDPTEVRVEEVMGQRGLEREEAVAFIEEEEDHILDT